MTAQDIVEKLIRDLVDNKKYKPGDKVATEGQISVKYNVTRAIARNALQRLVLIGVVYPLKSRGYFYSPFPFHNNISDIQDQYNCVCISSSFKMNRLDPELVSNSPLPIQDDSFFGHSLTFSNTKIPNFFANVWLSKKVIKTPLPFEQNQNFKLLEWLKTKNYLITHSFRLKKYREIDNKKYININEYMYISTELIACRQVFIPVELYEDFSISFPYK